jgi:hypothetical protein
LLADSGIPVMRTLTINGYPLLYPRRLAKRLNAGGPIAADQARSLRELLADRFPRA